MEAGPGTRLGPYELISRIGAGGMGEVYKARDTRLDRSVAIKVLSAEFARNPQLKLRMEREAKTISQLNHPHICTLYDVGDDYLVMELLEGETLAERIVRGPLPLADVLKYGAQIADALDQAHKAGVVHRDLKPANVMLTRGGAKLLDFGLAKTSLDRVDPDGPTQHHEKALTQEGTILGTFQYMAPEQLEAEEADARTDIFALGAVLYEMVTGTRAFQGKTKTSLIAAIVGGQPQPISRVVALSPNALDHVIAKCLEKERDDRWQSAHDIAEELKWIATTPEVGAAGNARANRIAVAAAALLAVIATVLAVLYAQARNRPLPRTAFAILPPAGYDAGSARLSPDGTSIAFSALDRNGEGGMWIRSVHDIEAKRLTSNPDDVVGGWSPDSKWIAFMTRAETGRQFRRISPSGGASELISPHVNRLNSMAWGRDGSIVYQAIFGKGLFVLPPNGEKPVEITKLDAKRRESFHITPVFLGDGKRFLYVIHTIAAEPNEVWAGSTDGALRRMVFRADSLIGIARGRAYFTRDGTVYAQSLDEKALQLKGEPQRIAARVHFYEPDAMSSAVIADNGALLYRPPLLARVEWGWYDRTGRRIEKVHEDVGMHPRGLSPDGRKVLATRFEPSKGADDIYVIDLERGLRTKLTTGLSFNQSPRWSPSGKQIYFSSDRDGPYDIYVQAEDGSTPPVVVWKSERDKDVAGVTPDGQALICLEHTAQTRADLWLVPVSDPAKRTLIIGTEANEDAADLSPDGKWLAFNSDRSGRPELYVRRLEGGRVTQISTNGTRGMIWSADGSQILFRGTNNERVAIPLTFAGDEVIPGKPIPLFSAPAARYAAIAETAKGILISTVPDPSDYIAPMYYDSAPIE